MACHANTREKFKYIRLPTLAGNASAPRDKNHSVKIGLTLAGPVAKYMPAFATGVALLQTAVRFERHYRSGFWERSY
jgi:hypothetical protein